jgi:hypothetical protein
MTKTAPTITRQGKTNMTWRPTSDRLKQGLRNAVESVLKVKLQGHIIGASGKARAERVANALAPPWDAHDKLQGGQDRPGVEADRHGTEAQRSHIDTLKPLTMSCFSKMGSLSPLASPKRLSMNVAQMCASCCPHTACCYRIFPMRTMLFIVATFNRNG